MNFKLYASVALALTIGITSCCEEVDDERPSTPSSNPTSSIVVTPVDLTLPSGTIWADRNLGADTEEGFGDFYAWGETKPQDITSSTAYSWSSYKFGSNSNNLTKYNSTDGYTELQPSDDAATVNLGDEWQIPSKEQMDELLDGSATTVVYTTQNGVKGFLITSKADNSKIIFLPAAGCYNNGTSHHDNGTAGHYWSRSLYPINSRIGGGYDISFYSSGINDRYGARNFGESIRPVRKK